MIDVLYVVGNGSTWKNNELRYSIRSVVKHLKGVGNIVVSGTKPNWLDVKHVPGNDSGRTAQESVYLKLKKALPELSEDFLFFNDDYFLLKSFQANKFPFFYKETLEEFIQRRRTKDSYKNAVENTFKVLSDKNLPTLNFENHAPMLINKTKFLEVMSQYPWPLFGFVLKSLYANTLKIKGTPDKDMKINYPQTVEEYKSMTSERKYFSTDKLLPTNLKEFLTITYPAKSKFEND